MKICTSPQRWRTDGWIGWDSINEDTGQLTEMKGGLLLDVVVGAGMTILEPLAGEDQALLVRRDALLVLDLGLDVVDGIGGLGLEGNSLTRQVLDSY